MNQKSVRVAAVAASCLLLVTAGGAALHRLNSAPGTNSTFSYGRVLSSKISVPHYRLSSGQLKRTAVSVWQKPLRYDGTPGKPGKNFAALVRAYHLSLVPTYDGSNQETHPKLLYFPEGWNGYQYWMSMTPYPAGNDDYENPSIVVSNDLKTWMVPKGLKNPITGVPGDVKYGGHYSDPHLSMNGETMELWFRADAGNRKTMRPNYAADYYYRTTSTDGIHWSRPQQMQSSKDMILSLAVIHSQNRYRFWYTNRSYQLMSAESGDGTHWTNVRKCVIPLPKGYSPWHQDVVFCNNRYYLLQTGIHRRNYTFALFLSESADGVHFTRGTFFYPSGNPVILHKTWLYRSTFVPVENGMFQMMVSYYLPGSKWYMTQCSLSAKEWDEACRTNKRVILNQPDGSSNPEPAAESSASRKV